MSMEPEGDLGLRYKVGLLYTLTASYQTVAALLGVTAQVVENFLTITDWVPQPADVAAMQTNLPLVDPMPGFERRTSENAYQRVIVKEAPFWTDDALDAIEVPPGTYKFKWHYWGESEGTHVISSQPMSFPLYDPATQARALVGADLQDLICVVFFVGL